MFWYWIVPRLNSVSHPVDAVPGALPAGDTGRADSLPSGLQMRSLPALGAAVEGTGGTGGTLPNGGGGNVGVCGALIAAYPGGGTAGVGAGGAHAAAAGSGAPGTADTGAPAGAGCSSWC